MIRNKLQVQSLEARSLMSATSILADSLGNPPAQVHTMDDWEFTASKHGDGQDAVFIKEVDPRDDPFFRGGEYMWTPGDERDAVYIKEVDPRPADLLSSGTPTGRDDPFFRDGDERDQFFIKEVDPAADVEYMWTETAIGQKV